MERNCNKLLIMINYCDYLRFNTVFLSPSGCYFSSAHSLLFLSALSASGPPFLRTIHKKDYFVRYIYHSFIYSILSTTMGVFCCCSCRYSAVCKIYICPTKQFTFGEFFFCISESGDAHCEGQIDFDYIYRLSEASSSTVTLDIAAGSAQLGLRVYKLRSNANHCR